MKKRMVSNILITLREVVKKKNGYFTVRLTIRVGPPPPLTVSCFVFFSEVYI